MILFLCTTIAVSFLVVACSNDTPSKQKTENADEIESDTKKTSGDEKQKIELPDTPLQKKDKNEQVTALQQALDFIGYPVDISSEFDDLTTWALTDIQLQSEDLYATGMYEDDTRKYIQKVLDGEATIEVGKALTKPKHPNAYPETIENPYDILAVANKKHALPEEYEPNDLVTPDIRFPFEEDLPKKKMRQIAADAIEALFNAGDEAGVNLFGQSGYRSFDRQVAIFASYTERHGEEHANTYSAKAGESEHQTGLVMDVTSQDIGLQINTDFGTTDEGKWLQEHAHEFGFIIRYPEDKVEITKYQYEPWHIRYVGKKAAAEIYKNNSTLEEYLELQ